MSAARDTTARPHNLVLVQGGLHAARRQDTGSARDERESSDWDDFCHRIGWQTDAPEPDEGFEHRIAERLLDGPLAPDNVIDLDLAREARDLSHPRGLERPTSIDSGTFPALRREDIDSGTFPALRCEEAALATLTHDGAAERARGRSPASRRPLPRGAVTAVTIAFAAAVVLAFVRLTFFSPAPAASIATPDPDGSRGVMAIPSAHATATAPDDAAPSEDPTAKPPNQQEAPRDAAPDARPEPPGVRLARRSPAKTPDLEEGDPSSVARRDSASPAHRSDNYSMYSKSSPAWGIPAQGVAARPGASLGAARDHDLSGRPGALHASAHPSPWSAGAHYGASLSAARGASPVPVQAGTDVWSTASLSAASARAETARPAGASWSLAGAKDRWVGASFAAPPAPFAVANVGVMVEVDIGNALGNL